MKARILIILMGLFLQMGLQAQITAIPDSNFEQALIDLGIDDVLDGGVLTSSVETVTSLQIDNKGITNLSGIEAFVNLVELSASQYNNLNTIDLSNNLNLKVLYLTNNQATAINVSENVNLEVLDISGNLISTIDVSAMPNLKTLRCNVNHLTFLNISNNTFLEELEVGGNEITVIDISNNQQLQKLEISRNGITSLDISTNLVLEYLNCSNNQLTFLNISNNNEIVDLRASDNPLGSINLSMNQKLKNVELNNCQLTEIDVSNNPLIRTLSCDNNQLVEFDVRNNLLLEGLTAANNQLVQIDLSKNIILKGLLLQGNKFSELDFSHNPMMVTLALHYNPLLYSLNLKNGGNQLLTTFDATNCLNLTCIQVDDAAWSTANWTNIDPQMSFSEDCGGGAYTMIPDGNFEQALIDLGLDDVADGQVLTGNVNSVTSLDVSSKNISDLTGIEAFVALVELNCNSNQLTSLNVSSNIALTRLYFTENQITSIDLTSNTSLKELDCSRNSFSTINVSKNTALTHLMCWDNQLTSLDVTKNPDLIHLTCGGNRLTSLDVSYNPGLNTFWCENNQLTSMDLSNNPTIIFFHCNNNQLTSLDIKYSSGDIYWYFDVTNNPNLSCIQVDDPAWWDAKPKLVDPQTSFSENCGLTGADSDGDGIPDDFDDYPQDETRAFDNYFPASGYGSLAFEDLWPGKGDYDFNDVVVDYRFQAVTNAANEVVKVYARFVLKASGASLRNGFGFNLPNASQNLIAHLENVNVSGYHVTEPFVDLMENGMEAQQSKPTFIVFDDFFNVMEHPGMGLGINTELSSAFVEFEPVTLEITPVDVQTSLSDFSFETWNPFIIVNHERGKEIHLADHRPTDLADFSIFGSYEDASDPVTGKFYKTANNLPWAINIVQEFVWPLEKISIVEAYHHFFEWASSSGTEYNNWYENVQGYRNDDKLYIHE